MLNDLTFGSTTVLNACWARQMLKPFKRALSILSVFPKGEILTFQSSDEGCSDSDNRNTIEMNITTKYIHPLPTPSILGDPGASLTFVALGLQGCTPCKCCLQRSCILCWTGIGSSTDEGESICPIYSKTVLKIDSTLKSLILICCSFSLNSYSLSTFLQTQEQ